MKILFDQGVPAPLRLGLTEHQVSTASEMNWSSLANGELLCAAQSGGFDIFVTTDQNLQYQQNLSRHTLRILVLTTTSWPRIQRAVGDVALAVKDLKPGEYRELFFRK